MASTAAEEELWLSGEHPALSRNAEAMSTLRSTSPTRSISPTGSTSSKSSSSTSSRSPRFRAIDSDPPTSTFPTGFNKNRSSHSGASNTGPKGVLADWKASQPGGERKTSHTGPKGVLADWKESHLFKPVGGIGIGGGGNGIDLSPKSGGIKIISLDNLRVSDDEGVDIELQRELIREENLTEEEKAIESYRRKRLFELNGSGNIERNNRNNRKIFGHLREIGIDQFLNAVEDEDPEVAVVIHIYEPHIETCAILNHHLSSIARDYPNTKFLRALATEVDFSADTEDDTLPTVLIYRGGELESTLVRIDHEWGTGARAEIVELLQKHNAIPDSSYVIHARESRSDSDEYE